MSCSEFLVRSSTSSVSSSNTRCLGGAEETEACRSPLLLPGITGYWLWARDGVWGQRRIARGGFWGREGRREEGARVGGREGLRGAGSGAEEGEGAGESPAEIRSWEVHCVNAVLEMQRNDNEPLSGTLEMILLYSSGVEQHTGGLTPRDAGDNL